MQINSLIDPVSRKFLLQNIRAHVVFNSDRMIVPSVSIPGENFLGNHFLTCFVLDDRFLITKHASHLETTDHGTLQSEKKSRKTGEPGKLPLCIETSSGEIHTTGNVQINKNVPNFDLPLDDDNDMDYKGVYVDLPDQTVLNAAV